MARDLRPKHKLCRKFGEKLCDSPKCPVSRRSYPPGVHGPSRKRPKISGYGKQLLEKQKVKRIYGILERQFSNYVAEASKKTGDTSKFLLTYLESRLDNVVYRTGLANSRAAARQLVNHGHIVVNGGKVTIPSFRVKVSDQITLRDRSKASKLFEGRGETIAKKDFPSWLIVDSKSLSAKVLNTPTVENPNFDANAIIGFYSR
ncbi:MAG TPA: 30S ribosomal protein S4 [Patescibacteria group bacterium]|nr:30S ribosomal protein S4 [Patescibacteria group bacterium]